MLDLSGLSFNYDPFPVGVAQSVFPADFYADLCRSFPDPELFLLQPGNGNRLSFSHNTRPAAFRRFLRRRPPWSDLCRWLQNTSFKQDFLELLISHGINFGFPTRESGLRERAQYYLRELKTGRVLGWKTSLRLSFSMLPAKGGYLLPHTDSKHKIANLVFPVVTDGEMDPSIGGGTDINTPRDRRHSFDRSNARLDFDDVGVSYTVPFLPNQVMVVIRTDRSWHSVAPLRGTDPGVYRRAFNISLMDH